MPESPFVGRENELEALQNAISTSQSASMIPVVGPTGIGKSTLLAKFVRQCREQDFRVLHYELNEPPSVDQFLSRLIEHWEDIHPSTVPKSSQTGGRDLISNVGESLSTSSGYAGSIVGGVVSTFARGHDDDVTDITSTLLELAVETRNRSPNDKFVLVIDQFDESRIHQEVYGEIATILREIAADAPPNVICCVGTRERFYETTSADIHEIELGPFQVQDVQVYLDELGLDPSAAARVNDAASGSPYFVERIGQIATETGDIDAVLEDLSEVESERRRMLTERFLDTLDDSAYHLLRETCFLPELRPRPVAYILDEEVLPIETELRRLERKSILTRLGYRKGNPVYRLHGINRDFLRERLDDENRTEQHAKAAAYYATQLANTGVDDFRELLTEEGVERQRDYMTAGVMFEFHLQQLPALLDAEERIEQIFEFVPDQDPSPREAAYSYFREYRHYSVDVEALGVTPAIDSQTVQEALKDSSSAPPRGVAGTESLIRGLQAEDSLNDDQTEAILLMGNAAKLLVASDSDEFSESDAISRLDSIQDQLTTNRLPEAPELCRIGQVAIEGVKALISEEGDMDGVWVTFETEYGVTEEDYNLLFGTVTDTLDCLFDVSKFTGWMQDVEENPITATSHLEGDVSVEQDGIELSLVDGLSSPLFVVPHALQAPSAEELESLSSQWAELEDRFDDRDLDFLAAFCRDVQGILIDSIPPDAAKTRVGLALMKATQNDGIEFINYEPVETIRTVASVLNGVMKKDPELQEE